MKKGFFLFLVESKKKIRTYKLFSYLKRLFNRKHLNGGLLKLI